MLDTASRPLGQSVTSSLLSAPTSPTLTNPDMILPDYERTPSPDRLHEPPQSAPMAWNGTQPSAPRNPQAAFGQQHLHGFIGVAIAPTTPIIYGNGTMLSDIGEVTEAESTPGKPSPPRQRHAPSIVADLPLSAIKTHDSENDAALRSSPTIGKSGPVVDVQSVASIRKRAKAAQRERRSSTDSDSTITHGDHPAAFFADFDDTASVEDSVFQGDDEESLASSYVDDSSVPDGPSLLASGLSRDAGHKYTTAQLSRRAEQILANAKKRLTHMEDNLSRARTSLLAVSPRDFSEASTPSPPITRTSTALMSTTGQQRPSSGHQRITSDNALRIGLPIKIYQQRSSSVLETSRVSRPQVLTVSKSADQLNGQYNRHRTSYIMRDVSLETLGEHDVSQPIHRLSATASPTFGVAASPGLTRSASTAQIRDIKDHVKDLKGKISSLREQTRTDSLQRRSLQSLRTPSPFTYAPVNLWYSGNESMDSDVKSQTSKAAAPFLGENRSSFESHSRNGAHCLDAAQSSSARVLHDPENEEVEQFQFHDMEHPYENEMEVDDDMLTEIGDSEEELQDEDKESEYVEAAEDGYDLVSESGDSIYHESVQHQLSHEDREDAFDYEHFFLHSAMGTWSRHAERRDSVASYSSQDSVETTRGPAVEDKFLQGETTPILSRRGSERSISTIESFATATEGLESHQGSIAKLGNSAAEDEEDGKEQGENDGLQEAFPMLCSIPGNSDNSESLQAVKWSTFAGIGSPPLKSSQPSRASGLNSAVRRPISSSVMTRPHATSVSSFESTGTTRSFPLVNKTPKQNGRSDSGRKSSFSLAEGQVGGSSLGSKNSISLYSTNSTTSLIEENGTAAVMETLPRDDQFLVERLVASLGRCVLGLTDSGRATTENRMYRRRIDAARKILEGFEPV